MRPTAEGHTEIERGSLSLSLAVKNTFPPPHDSGPNLYDTTVENHFGALLIRYPSMRALVRCIWFLEKTCEERRVGLVMYN